MINGLPRVGAIVGEPSLWGHLSIWDNLRCARGIYNTNESGCELSDLLDTVGLEEADRSRRFRDCSTGMKQRLAYCSNMLGDPDILVLVTHNQRTSTSGNRRIIAGNGAKAIAKRRWVSSRTYYHGKPPSE